ncbi:SLBB domain-containing protein [bacterium]|nr:SLBB domain-containing protein [bacterium]
MKNKFPDKVEDLGIVGCGGAGFPTHVKLSAKDVTCFIVNAAECEPLLHKDKEILKHHTADFFKGLETAMSMTGAKVTHIAVKEKYSELISQLKSFCSNPKISVFPLGDFYPSGDEFELVYEITKKLIPFGGIPLQIGCVVNNVETLLHLGRGKPFTSKFLTVAGAVPKPVSIEVPLGITVREAISLSGQIDLCDMAIIDGGPMMGRIVSPENLVTKTCGGLVVLPKEHPLIVKMTRPARRNQLIGRAGCDQCTDCTELCPRRLLGYPIRPHKAMRTNLFTRGDSSDYSLESIFCSECGVCSLFACPEALPPREVTIIAKRYHLSHGAKLSDWQGVPQVHPMRPGRRIGIQRLINCLGLTEFDRKAPLIQAKIDPPHVRLPLKMNLGAPAQPSVKVGDDVTTGQLIGIIPERSLGANLHASISGRVVSIDDAITIEA